MSYIDSRWALGEGDKRGSFLYPTGEPWLDLFDNPAREYPPEAEPKKIWHAMRTSLHSLLRVVTVMSAFTMPSNSMPSLIEAAEMLKKQPPKITGEMMPFVDRLLIQLQAGGTCAHFTTSGNMVTVTRKDVAGLRMNIYRPNGNLEVSLEDNGPNGADGVIGTGVRDISTREKSPLGLRFTSIDGFNDKKPPQDMIAYQKYLQIMAKNCTFVAPSGDI